MNKGCHVFRQIMHKYRPKSVLLRINKRFFLFETEKIREARIKQRNNLCILHKNNQLIRVAS